MLLAALSAAPYLPAYRWAGSPPPAAFCQYYSTRATVYAARIAAGIDSAARLRATVDREYVPIDPRGRVLRAVVDGAAAAQDPLLYGARVADRCYRAILPAVTGTDGL